MISELKHSLRISLKEPLSTFMGIAALGLAIGLSAALFSILYGSLWKPLPMPDPDQIVRVARIGPDGPRGIGAELAQAWGDHDLDSLDAVVPWTGVGLVFSGDGRPAMMHQGAYVAASFFDAVRVSPVAGRVFREGDDLESAPRTLVLSYELWATRYGADPTILGETVRVGGDEATIIGVMPEGFAFPIQQEFWMPLAHFMPTLRSSQHLTLDVFGRLTEGSEPEEAELELGLLADRILSEESVDAGIGETIAEPEVRTSVDRFVDAYTRKDRNTFTMIAVGVLGVLLIGCSNVSNLLLARWTARRRELATRWALGADRGTLVRHLLFDPVLFSTIGGGLGIGVAKIIIDLYVRGGGLVEGFWVEIGLSPIVFLVIVATVLLCALLSGLLPAWRLTRRDHASWLEDQAHGSTSGSAGRLRGWLVAGQAALCTGLLVTTLLLVRSVGNLESEDFGDAPEKIWASQVIVDTSVYPDWKRWLTFFDDLDRRLSELPSVTEVAFASHLPSDRTRKMHFRLQGVEKEPPAGLPEARWSVVSGNFFDAFGRPVLKGRAFNSQDRPGNPPTVIINQQMATRYFPAEEPVGQRIQLEQFGQLWFTIVGVVPDLYLSWDYFSQEITQELEAGFYLPLGQHPKPGANIILRTETEDAVATPAVRRTLAEFSPDMPLLQPRTMSERIEEVTARYRMVRSAFAVFGLAALVLSAAGLFALVSFVAAQKERDFAIRMALGAGRWKITRAVAAGPVLQVFLGILLGLAAGVAVTRTLGAFLYDVEAFDLVSLGLTFAVLSVTTAAACFAPVRRTLRLDPADVLRGE